MQARLPGHRTAIARREELPLLQGEVRQLIKADELKLRALILIDVAFVAAISEAGGRTVLPGDDMLGLVVFLVQRARHIAAEMGQQRRFEFRIGAPQQQRIRSWHLVRLADRLP
jgi:hypothetical protein